MKLVKLTERAFRNDAEDRFVWINPGAVVAVTPATPDDVNPGITIIRLIGDVTREIRGDAEAIVAALNDGLA